jgi:hypothetical protein
LFGAGLEDDLLAGEVFELADEVALAASLIDLGGVEVGSEILVAGCGSASRCQTMVRTELPTATIARCLPRRRAGRR